MNRREAFLGATALSVAVVIPPEVSVTPAAESYITIREFEEYWKMREFNMITIETVMKEYGLEPKYLDEMAFEG